MTRYGFIFQGTKVADTEMCVLKVLPYINKPLRLHDIKMVGVK